MAFCNQLTATTQFFILPSPSLCSCRLPPCFQARGKKQPGLLALAGIKVSFHSAFILVSTPSLVCAAVWQTSIIPLFVAFCCEPALLLAQLLRQVGIWVDPIVHARMFVVQLRCRAPSINHNAIVDRMPRSSHTHAHSHSHSLSSSSSSLSSLFQFPILLHSLQHQLPTGLKPL